MWPRDAALTTAVAPLALADVVFFLAPAGARRAAVARLLLMRPAPLVADAALRVAGAFLRRAAVARFDVA